MSHFDFGHFLPIRWVRSSRSVQAVSSGLHGLLPESGPRPPSPLRPPPFRRFRSPLSSRLRRCGSAASAYFAALPTATKGRGGRDSRRKRGGRVEDGERGGGEDGRGRERDETSSGSGAKFGLGVPDGQREQSRRKGSGEAERGAGRSHPQGSVGGRAKYVKMEVDFGVLCPPSDPVFKSIYRVRSVFSFGLIMIPPSGSRPHGSRHLLGIVPPNNSMPTPMPTQLSDSGGMVSGMSSPGGSINPPPGSINPMETFCTVPGQIRILQGVQTEIRSFSTGPGRLSLLSSTPKYRVTVGEIHRLVFPCLISTFLICSLTRSSSLL